MLRSASGLRGPPRPRTPRDWRVGGTFEEGRRHTVLVTECDHQALPTMPRVGRQTGLGVATGSRRDQATIGSATSAGDHAYALNDEAVDLRTPQRPQTPPRDGQTGHTQTGRVTSIKYQVEFRVEFRVEITVELGPL